MNDALACFAVALVVMIVAAFIITVQIQNANQVRRAYRRLARNYNGSTSSGGPFDFPGVRFQYHNAFVWLAVQATSRKHAKHYTMLQVSWPDKRFRLEVYPQGLMQRLGKLVGMEDLEIGSSVFDDEYIITGNDLRAIRDFLTRDVQDCISRLNRFSDHQGIYVSVTGGRLLIKKPGYIRDYALLTRFVSLALEVYDQAVQASAEGIEFVAAAESTVPEDDPVCQICGEEIKIEAVLCRACKTPHHKDCWEYYGACSTFGCGQRRFIATR